MGFEVTETIAAMPGVLNLAAASQESLGTSADIVSNILSGFGLSAEDADAAVDILVQTMTTANTNLPQLGDAMKYVAPIAASLGIDMADVAAAVGKMSDAGIQGSQAGTALRAAMVSLANPTGQTVKAMEELGIQVTTADGAMKPLPELVGHIADKLDGMGEAQKTAAVAQLVGTEAASGFLALLEVGEDGLADYSNELRNSAGAAEEMASVQQDTVNGAFKEFQSAIEETGIKIGNEFLPVFREIIEAGTDLVRWISTFDGESIKLVASFAGIAAGIGLALTTLGKLTIALSTFALTPVGAAIIGIALLGGVIGTAVIASNDMKEVTLEKAEALIAEQDAMNTSVARYDELRDKMALSNDELMRFMDIDALMKQTSSPEVLQQLADEQARLLESSGLTNEEMYEFLGINDDLIALLPEANVQISEQGNALLENTDAAEALNAEMAKNIQLELDAQLARAEANHADNLREQASLQAEINELAANKIPLDETITEAQVKLNEYQRLYNEAKAEGDEREASMYENKISQQQRIIEGAQEQRAEQAELIVSKQEELDKVNEQIGKLDEVKLKMVAVELQQLGINVEKGKELETINQTLGQLDAQRQKLLDQTPVNMRNTEEFQTQIGKIDTQIAGLGSARTKVLEIYGSSQELTRELSKQSGEIDKKIGKLQSERSELMKNTPEAERQTQKFRDGIAAIDGQIAELQGVRGQIQGAITEANTMNTALGKAIYKDVFVKTHGDGGGVTRGVYHTGGIVGKQPLNQLPKLHTGGTVAKLAESFKAPMQHEMDVRLLRNEMVLTESQQANLMRMIDAGHSAQAPTAGFDPAVAALLSQIAQNTADGKNVSVTMSSDEVYEVVQDKMAQEHDYNNLFRGVLD